MTERKSKAPAYAILLVPAAAFFLLCVIPNVILDGILSFSLSAASRLDVRLHRARFTGADRLRFDSLAVSQDGRPLFSSNEGLWRIQSILPAFRSEAELNRVHFERSLVPAFINFDSAIPSGYQKGIEISRLGLRFKIDRSAELVQAYRWESDAMRIKGGVLRKNGKIQKIHALFLVPKGILSHSVSEKMMLRLVDSQNGWVGGYVVYANHLLTALGKRGPIFQAQWAFSN